ncbi:hypothetical protein BHE74_00015640, partial [Ensete ventricosum]
SATAADSLVGIFSYKPFDVQVDWSFVAKSSPCYITSDPSFGNCSCRAGAIVLSSKSLSLIFITFMVTGTLFYFIKMTIDGVKRTAQEQMTRVLKEQSRFVYVSTVKQTIRFFFLGSPYHDKLLSKVFHTDLYRPYRVVCTGPLGYRYVDCPLSGGIAKIDHRRSIEGERGKKKKKRKRRMRKEEKKKEYLASSSPVRRRCPRVARAPPTPSPAGRPRAVIVYDENYYILIRSTIEEDLDPAARFAISGIGPILVWPLLTYCVSFVGMYHDIIWGRRGGEEEGRRKNERRKKEDETEEAVVEEVYRSG